MPVEITTDTILGAGSGRAISGTKAPTRPPYTPIGAPQYIQFVGSLTNGVKLVQFKFSVLAGPDLAPTITSGFAKWNIVGRPQRVGFTVHDGYDPITLSVPIMFDAVASGSGVDIEADIQKLEWMAGRGKLYAADGGIGAPGQGDSPIVNIYSANTTGLETNLIPPNVHDIDWVVTSLDYDTGPFRNAAGNRVRQLVTVTLLEHVGAPGATYDSPSTRARQLAADAGKSKTVTTAVDADTYRKLAVKYVPKPTLKAATDIMKANRKSKNRALASVRSVDKPLPLNVKVKIPLAIYQGLST